MPMKARIGDKVTIHCPHSGIGTIITGSPTVQDCGQRVARIGDQVRCDNCGQIGQIVSGSDIEWADGIHVARIGDHIVITCDLHLPDCPHPGQSGDIATGSPVTNVTK